MQRTLTEAAKPASFDHNKDRYPDAREALGRLIKETELPSGPVERIEATFLASGEATYRVWAARSQEPEGGYLPGG